MQLPIILYTTENCTICPGVRNWLRSHDIIFTERNLADPVVLTDLRCDGCFGLAAPIMRVGQVYYEQLHLDGDQLYDGTTKLEIG